MLTSLVRELYACRPLSGLAGLDPAVPVADRAFCGLDRVVVDGALYQPDPEGEPALIAAAFEHGQLVDLVATSTSPAGFGVATRRGEASVLGHDALEDSRWDGTPLKLYESAWSWLRHGRQGAVILDWRRAPFQLDDMPAIVCETRALGLRIEKAFARPIPMPPLFVPPAVQPDVQELSHA